MANKDWLRFELNAEGDVREFFEKEFSKRFFSLQNDIPFEDINIPPNYPGIENIPVNGIAYQSKYSVRWDQYTHSLDQIIKNHTSKYPGLRKVYFYVSDCSLSESEERAKPDGRFAKLKGMGVEIKFMDMAGLYEMINKDDKYIPLRKYFTIPKDCRGLLDLAKKYIDELYLDDAKLILDLIDRDYESLSDDQKFVYHKWLGNWKCYSQEFTGQGGVPYENEYLKACNFEKTTPGSKILKCIAYIQKKEFEGLETVLNTILDGAFEVMAQRALIMLYSAQGISFEEILTRIRPDYKTEPLILKMIGRIAFEQKALKLAQEYFFTGLSESDSFIDKIAGLEIRMAYAQDTYGLDDITIEGKNEYEKVIEYYDSIKNDLPGRSIKKEIAQVYNFLGVIKKRFFNDHDGAICLLKQALDIDQDPVIEFNLAKLYNDNKEPVKAKAILISLYDNIGDYLSNRTIEQVPALLAQIYTLEGDPNSGIAVLEDFMKRYGGNLSAGAQRNINLALLQALNNVGRSKEALEMIDKLVNDSPEDFIFYLIQHQISKDISFLEKAYDIAKDLGPSEAHRSYDFLELALRLREFGFHEQSFQLYKKHLVNLQEIQHVENFISLCIERNSFELAKKKIGEYIPLVGEDEFSIYCTAVISRREGNLGKAKEVIINFTGYELNPELLFELARACYESDDKELLITTILRIETYPKLLNLQVSALCEFINFYYTFVDKEEAVRKIYKYIQALPGADELKNLYFSLLLHPGALSQDEENKIDENKIVTVKECGTERLFKISFDGITKMNVDFHYHIGDATYTKLVGKFVGDSCRDIFKENPIYSKEYEIISIEDKYIVLYHSVMRYMEHSGKLESIPVGDDPDILIEVLSKMDSGIKERNAQLDEIYQQGLLSVGMISQFTGRTYCEAYKAITHGTQWNIISDMATKFESKEKLPKDFLIDPSGIFTLFEMSLDHLSKEGHCKFYITKSTFDYFTDEIFKGQQSLGLVNSTIVGLEDGGRTIIEHTHEEKKLDLKRIINIKEWMKECCETIPNPSRDSHEEKIREALGEEFYDSMIVAKGKNLVLYSDDIVIRKLSKSNEITVTSIGSEGLLGVLFGQNLIDITTYCDSLRRLMTLNFEKLNFTTGVILGSAIKKDAKAAQEELEIIYGYCKIHNVDISFVLVSIFEVVGNLLGNHNFANDRFNIILSAILKYYSLEEIKTQYVLALDKITTSEVRDRFFQMMMEYESSLV